MKKKTIVILSLSAVLLAGIIIGIASVSSYFKNYDQTISNITISNVDLSGIRDGIYSGSCKAFPVAAEVKVTVKEHRITDIVLVKHQKGKGGPAEIIPDKVLKAQSLDIELVSGATYSSKVILKAIENALDKGHK